ncbi:MAG: FtsQ-type POTRA domain-containing protein [Rubrobacteraceae bacterium]|nr:FtsQ-type POTRA domain-containing protein [Rubrobacteraceae bacterium]
MRVEGANMYPESEAVNAIPDHASLLTLNTDLLAARVKSNVWVEGAEVNENWKSGIVTVQVEERRPMLYAEVDGREIILSSGGEELPGLGGAGLDLMVLDRDQVGEILDFARTLQDNGIRVDSVDGAGAYGIRATVQGRPVIFSRDVDNGQAEALKNIMPEHPHARLFDLRSPDRVVVGAQVQGNTDSDRRG